MRFALDAGGIAAAVFLTSVSMAQDPFAAGVRTTDPLSPAEERLSFQLPPGFEMQLVAAEPEIQKPLNMAFDARGRLWITDTTEYPYPAPPDQPGRDTIKVLEDADGDGRTERVTTFAEGLNIPIGLYPYKNGVIAYSIPNIYFFEDTDGDGRSDKTTKLFGPFDYSRDTHGMQNAFRRGFDGWLYACHGFNNNSTVSGADGHTINMQSGNTYRMRLDGSRIEQFTWGQVNPFGMTQDPLGNLFTADCHSKPVYQLLRGGYYPSFGKPDDGLGFVPPMMEHLHGSTAIAGVAVYADEVFPPEYRGNLFSGNVMTSRVNRNSMVYHGSTIAAKEEPDLVATTDPWFRPVDIQLAPDGSLYIADFYNRIIGHYEVPLDHPGRDRHSGRIWRLVYQGEGESRKPRVDLTKLDAAGLVAALDSPNFTARMLAVHEINDRIGEPAAPELQKAFAKSENPNVRAHALWALERLGRLNHDSLKFAASDADRTVRVHAMRVLSERREWSKQERELALAGLDDSDAFVRRAAADALGQHHHFGHIEPLLELTVSAPAEDVLLRHTARMALRNQLRDGANVAKLASLSLDPNQDKTVAGGMIAVGSPESAAWLIDYVERNQVDAGQLRRIVEYAARYVNSERLDSLGQIARRSFGGDLELQQSLLRSIRDGLAQRGSAPPETLREWGAELAAALLDSVAGKSPQWINTPLPEARQQENPWVVQRRISDDGDAQSLFLCSLPRGEQLTGVLRSPEFEIPMKLSFYAAGHIGPPNQPVVARNFIRLKDAASGAVLAESTPPRNDTAQKIEWNLSAHRGGRGYVEIVDGDQRGAYAWLAVGRFEPQIVAVPEFDPAQIAQRQRAAAQLIGEFQLRKLLPRLLALLGEGQQEIATQKALAEAVLAVRPDPLLASLMPVVEEPATSDNLRHIVLNAIAQPEEQGRKEAVTKSFQQSPQRVQAAIAQNLASTKEGAESLLAIVELGLASPRLLTLAAVESRLATHKIEGLEERVSRLISTLPPANETLRQLIEQRRQRYQGFAVSLEHGAQVFQKHCAACHQVGGKGALIGPQLDGIGNRGLERVLEDVLAPNQNVDVAFRATTFILADGRVLSGLARREEGEVLIVANNKGEELKLPKREIEEQARTNLSLMPENVVEIVPEEDFHHLIGYLLSQRGEPASADAGSAQ